jgi:hypothetical protein
MARNNFIFLKNVKFFYLKTFFFDNFDNNFIFFKKNKALISNVRFIKIKKINFNKKCINILYF